MWPSPLCFNLLNASLILNALSILVINSGTPVERNGGKKIYPCSIPKFVNINVVVSIKAKVGISSAVLKLHRNLEFYN